MLHMGWWEGMLIFPELEHTHTHPWCVNAWGAFFNLPGIFDLFRKVTLRECADAAFFKVPGFTVDFQDFQILGKLLSLQGVVA